MPKETEQQKLADLPLRRRDAERIAEEILLEQIGSTPVLSDAKETEETYTFQVRVSFPRVILDETTEQPRKTRFVDVGTVGEIVVDRRTAKVIERPRYWDVQKAIRAKLYFITESVSKALVRAAADQFSLLPFPVHLHTPVVDVLSYLLVRDRLPFEEIQDAPELSAQKLTSALDPLQRVGLVTIQENTVLPGPVLIGMEEKYKTAHEQLSHALAHFFRDGYMFIDSIRQVLGPHLALSGIVYERAIEVNQLVPLSLQQIEKDFYQIYGPERAIKLPRYLVQLEGIGVTQMEVKSGVPMWKGVAQVYERVRGDEVLQPIDRMFA